MSNKPETDNEILARAVAREGMRASHDADRNRSEFLARMNHEFRTPLNAVIGFTRVLERNQGGNQTPHDLHLLSRVRAGGEQLLRLVENVLDHSSMKPSAMAPDVRDTDVLAIISRVAEEYRPRAAAKGIRLLVLLPEYAVGVRIDATHLERALRELLDNAIKFTASGVIKVKLATDMATGRPMRVSVSDTGDGIPVDELDRLTEVFEQRENAPRQHGGAGLGLRIASQLCTGMGCALSAKSEVGQGSSFSITFPSA